MKTTIGIFAVIGARVFETVLVAAYPMAGGLLALIHFRPATYVLVLVLAGMAIYTPTIVALGGIDRHDVRSLYAAWLHGANRIR